MRSVEGPKSLLRQCLSSTQAASFVRLHNRRKSRDMKLRKLAVVSAMTIAAVGIAGGTSYATPGQAAPDVKYTAHQEGQSSIVSIDSGSMAIENGVFKIKAASGAVLA